MAHTYKISVNKAFLLLSDEESNVTPIGVRFYGKYTSCKCPTTKYEWKQLLTSIFNANQGYYGILTGDSKEAYESLRNSLNYLEAAGGLVRNGYGEYLLIFRMGHWDLPKGKIEQQESPREASLREVEEECGLESIRVLEKHYPYPWSQEGSMHIYLTAEGFAMKLTHWFNMSVDGRPNLIPQKSEGIERAIWAAKHELPALIPRAYPNIADILAGLEDS